MSLARHKTNPFLDDMIVPVKGKQVRLSRLGRDENILVNQSTGEVQGTHVTTFKRVDGEQFVKLFTANIGLTFDLSAAGIKAFGVLLWVVQNRALSKDEVDMDSFALEDFLETQAASNEQPLRLSLATFKRGINELEKAQIVAKTMRQGRYFINPNFVFNGDRIAFTTVIERKRATEQERLEAQGQQRLEIEDEQ
ncbi:TPA: replication/maintenance protein RepL [Klebsiella pneumoniae]|nr:replication/maintenance protein RepL [Klebsiella pneumoniae]